MIEGLPGSGKSSALFQLKNGETLLTPTPGGEGFYVESVRHARTRLNIWEVHSPTVRDKCLSTARALCFVVDCTEDAVGIGQAKTELDSILSCVASQSPRSCFTLLVLANKQDVGGALAPTKLERVLNLSTRSDADTWRWAIHSCSATKGLGLKEGMDWLATSVRKNPPSWAKPKQRPLDGSSGGGRGNAKPAAMGGVPVS